ncbi:MAG: molybdopterin converting factor small subunit [Saprospiraceae bacterium]|nr:MAG: molybdopterin converting factor small subunit [Saprospiraceae bacterium]GIW83470.1 MAG: molybdopterin converting factor small subunit [Gemmatales bacterium]
MKLQLLAFGIARDITGQRFLELELPEGTTVARLREWLTEKHPRFNSLASLRFAVNNEYAEEERTLQDGDEVAIIPPVSGG